MSSAGAYPCHKQVFTRITRFLGIKVTHVQKAYHRALILSPNPWETRARYLLTSHLRGKYMII